MLVLRVTMRVAGWGQRLIWRLIGSMRFMLPPIESDVWAGGPKGVWWSSQR